MKTTLIPAVTHLKVSVSRLRCSQILEEVQQSGEKQGKLKLPCGTGPVPDLENRY